MGSLILVTIILYCGNSEPVKLMKFILPHNLEMNEIDSNIMKFIKNRKPFPMCNCMAVVDKVEHMIDWKKIGEEIK